MTGSINSNGNSNGKIRYLTFGWKISRIPFLSRILHGPVHYVLPFAFASKNVCFIGWGRKSKLAEQFSSLRRAGFISLEDGFLRSCDLGVNGAPPLSLVLDSQGIYYDSTRPSELEQIIASHSTCGALNAQAEQAIELIRKFRLSKYNRSPDRLLSGPDTPARIRVLVVDQTVGDLSVLLGGASKETFARMLEAAIHENPGADILVKTHPDVLAGKKQGYLDGLMSNDRSSPHVHVLREDAAPLSLLEQVDAVYVVTSQMGFEALLLEKRVVCFGIPWYAGWGMTDDRHPDSPGILRNRRSTARSLNDLFAAAYLRYTRYIDPVKGTSGTIFDVIDWLARNKDVNDRTRGELFCVGMSVWKRMVVRPFVSVPSNRVHFVSSVRALRQRRLPGDAVIVMWGRKNEKEVMEIASEAKLPVWRMEDGFLRSVGLGSDLFRPVSLVLDKGGIYYDPDSGSDLEHMIATQNLSAEEMERAGRFRQAYVASGLSKYNLGRSSLSVNARGRRVLLVPGQVEDDASVMLGSPTVKTNLSLLQAVRAANPEAYILYKAHPDVVSGNRHGAVDPEALAQLADQCVSDVNIIDCILASDEVHTMTSQAGFEALMHGRIVHCYGGPFYAGWGLTVDHFPLPHRRRRITLDELVHAALLEYPRYVLPGVNGFVSAEAAMAWLANRAARPASALRAKGIAGWLRRKMQKTVALAQFLRDEYKVILS